MDQPPRERRTILTIGHSNHPIEAFFDLLARHRVEALVDVRSAPASKYVPHFSRQALDRSAGEAGLGYLFLGKELGGRPSGPEFYDPNGRVDYARLARSPSFVRGIERLDACSETARVAILCSEEDPLGCHRRLLVGRVLADRDIRIEHVRGDGEVETEAEVAIRVARGRGGQLSVFDALGETEWKSIRSVSRRRRRPTSSGRSEARASGESSTCG